MADGQLVTVQIQVPSELENVANMVQSVVSQVQSGANWMTIVSALIPQLFAEGVKLDELKAEIKMPQAATLAGLAIGAGVTALLVAKAAKAAAAPVAAASAAVSNAVAQ